MSTILRKPVHDLLCGYGRSRRAGRHFCPGNTPREQLLSSFGHTNQPISFSLNYLFEIVCAIDFHTSNNKPNIIKISYVGAFLCANRDSLLPGNG